MVAEAKAEERRNYLKLASDADLEAELKERITKRNEERNAALRAEDEQDRKAINRLTARGYQVVKPLQLMEQLLQSKIDRGNK